MSAKPNSLQIQDEVLQRDAAGDLPAVLPKTI